MIVPLSVPPKARPRLRQRRGSVRGYTLLETVLATLLAALVLGSVMDLFLTATKLTTRSNALAASSLSSANAVQEVLKDTREAQSMRLPDDAGFQPLTGYAAIGTYYKTTLNGNTILTALQINLPARQTETVLDKSGSPIALAAASATSVIYDRQTLGTDYLLFYRGNSDQTPNPSSGKYLWKFQKSTGVTSMVCRNVATAASDAVQFLQPTGGSTEVAVKIVCSEYSLINGQQTNEETDGSTTSALTGKCALMRDYGAGNSASTDQGTCNHAFQHS